MKEPTEPLAEPIEDMRLMEPDCLSAEEMARPSGFKLPLPQKDREIIERRLRRKHLSKFTITEMMLVTTLFCVVMALSSWIPLGLYLLILGLVTAFVLAYNFLTQRNSRLTLLLTATLLGSYLVSIIVVILRLSPA